MNVIATHVGACLIHLFKMSLCPMSLKFSWGQEQSSFQEMVRSLVPKECQLMILTATPTKETKQQILHMLHVSEKDLQMVEQSPDKPKLFYAAHYLDNNEEIVGLIIFDG